MTWEAQQYRVDVAAPEMARLTEVRGLQAGNTLDTALALCRIGATLAASDSLARRARPRRRSTSFAPRSSRSSPASGPRRSPPPDLASLSEQAARDLARVRARGDLKRLGAIATRLGPAEDAALADVLTSLLYAVWLGDPQGQAFLAGNVARRHDYGVRLMSGAGRDETPWQIPSRPRATASPGTCAAPCWASTSAWLAWRCVGHGSTDPTDQPTLNDSDRRTMMLGWRDQRRSISIRPRRDASAAVAAGGRAIAGSPHRLDQRARGSQPRGRRRQAIAWASAHTPEQVAGAADADRAVLLGRPADVRLPAAWGAADTPRSGCFCLAFPSPPRCTGTWAGLVQGLLTSRTTD